jgi:ketosteroid isomerase-like protein
MSTTDNRQTAVRLVEGLPEGIPNTRAFLAEGFTWWTPRLGQIENRREELSAAFYKHLKSPLSMTVTGVTAEGDRVAVEAFCDAELTNGTTYHNLYHFLFEFRDGLVSAVREYNDSKHAYDIWTGLMA